MKLYNSKHDRYPTPVRDLRAGQIVLAQVLDKAGCTLSFQPCKVITPILHYTPTGEPVIKLEVIETKALALSYVRAIYKTNVATYIKADRESMDNWKREELKKLEAIRNRVNAKINSIINL